MLTLDLDPAALLKIAAQVASEYGCEVRITKSGNLMVRPLVEKRTSTERVRKHREAKRVAETSVMKAVSEQCETLFCDETHETHETPEPVSLELCPSPPLSPPSPNPPSSALTPAPVLTPEQERQRKLAKRQQTENDIAAANQELLPNSLNTTPFLTAWAEWRDHRSDLARLHPRKRWTPCAARNTLAECASHGAVKAEKAIRRAIANGWQGLVWDNNSDPRVNRTSYDGSRPRYPAYQVATATLGQSPEDISTF